jgi:hypothetical protein
MVIIYHGGDFEFFVRNIFILVLFLKILLFLDADMNRVPDDLSSLAEVWYLDGSSIYHNNNLGKKVLEKIIRDMVFCVPNMAVFEVFLVFMLYALWVIR